MPDDPIGEIERKVVAEAGRQARARNAAALMMIAAMAGAGIRCRKRPDPLEGIDISAEYQLIEQKRSKLSANMRRMVVARVIGGER